MRRILSFLLISLMAFFSAGAQSITEITSEPDTIEIQIISTSDLHGKMLPFYYARNEASYYGSMAQLSTAIKELRNDNTVLVDVGDTIQGNYAELFLDYPVHPMVHAQNLIGYDVCVLGNHEFNYGMDTVRSYITEHDCPVLCANVFDESGKPVSDPYVIIERSGVRIGIIGVVTPNIEVWDGPNLKEGHAHVTDPVEEIKKIVSQIRNDVDILVAACHMGPDNEYGLEDSGVLDLADKVPELDLILASHHHMPIEGLWHNGILITENDDSGETLSLITVTLESTDGGYRITSLTSEIYYMRDYGVDPMISEDPVILAAHNAAITDATSVIGYLTNNCLAPPSDIPGISSLRIMDSALTRLVNDVILYYSGADLAASSLSAMNANLFSGELRKCDISGVYKYEDLLYLVSMSGKQILKALESSAGYFNTFNEGDLIISFTPLFMTYDYIMFRGIRYEIDISQPAGDRIRNLTMADGSPFDLDRTYTVAVSDYYVKSMLTGRSSIFTDEDGEIEILDSDVASYLGGIRNMIVDYLTNQIVTETDSSGRNILTFEDVDESNAMWKVTGYHWNQEKHERLADLITAGKMRLKNRYNEYPITEEDLEQYLLTGICPW